ncbi:MAG: glycosyltransferase family 2 protein [Candidatus Portnoybacteria bacterium]|nr:glycosyltransferase family 2 protein [Candidatus Portnoybacteria bacterium]
MQNKPPISIIIPAFNEDSIVAQTISALQKELNAQSIRYEIIAVNDGSSDKTKEILEKTPGIRLINHPYQKGYGASLKTGTEAAQNEWLLFFDADGQHNPKDISLFFEQTTDYEMIIGARNGYQGPAWRQPGKKLIRIVASYLAERKIPDLNCGFRMIKKSLFLKYKHLFPDGFSLSTTSTLVFIKESRNVKFIPIKIGKRVGKSSLKPYDGFRVLILVTKLIMLFDPLKIFLPVSLTGLFASLAWMSYFLVTTDFSLIPKSSGFLFLSSLLIFLFGLLADQIAAIRREIHE